MDIKFFYRRNLPHFQKEYSSYFLNFRLYGSLPTFLLNRLKNEYLSNKKMIIDSEDKLSQSKKIYDLQKKYFGKFDNYLDRSLSVMNYLVDDRIAELTSSALHFLDGKDYELISYCIMPNHVHALITVERFLKPLYKTLQSIKRFSSRESNKILQRSGAFWNPENYDHIVRNQEEYEKIIKYILNNPVKANLVARPEDWKWSYLKGDK
ncbi:MAG: transposase [bacterium]